PPGPAPLVFVFIYEQKNSGGGVGQIIVGAKNGKFAGQGVNDLAPNMLGTGTLEVRRGRLQIADFPVFGSVQLPADILGTGRLLFSDQNVTLAIGRPLVKDVELGGTLEISGDNTLFLSGQKKLTIDFDTLKFTEDGGIFSTGSGRGIHRFENLVVEAAASLSVGSGQFLDFLGGHSDSDAALTLAGAGTVRFLGDTTLAGSLDIEGGVLEVQNGTTLTVGNLITLNETAFEPGLYAVSDLDGFSEIIGSGFINVVESAMSFPLVVQADNFVTDEATSITGNVFADNGSGVDSGEGLFVSEVNEQGIIPNLPITLPSGAQLTIDDEGNFTYDPDGQFSFLNGTEVSTDSFSYTVEDATGQTAQAVVSIDINGIDAPPVGSFQKVGTLIYGLSKNSQEVITFGSSNRKRTTLARTPFIEGDQPANATPELQFSNPDTLYVGTTGVGVIGSGSDTTISGSESLQLRLSGSSDTDDFSRANTVLLRLRADANTQVLVSGQSSQGETLFSEAVDLTPNLLAGSGDYKVNLRNLIPFQQLQLELGAADGAGPIEGFSLVYARFTVGV
ncbi:MAG: Ig-like domain-containing protein, partial [Cyanobacteria bacterium P01_H01_bin.15]